MERETLTLVAHSSKVQPCSALSLRSPEEGVRRVVVSTAMKGLTLHCLFNPALFMGTLDDYHLLGASSNTSRSNKL